MFSKVGVEFAQHLISMEKSGSVLYRLFCCKPIGHQVRPACTLSSVVDRNLAAIREASMVPRWHIVHARKERLQSMAGSDSGVINMSSLNYYDIAEHPAVREAAKEAMDKYRGGVTYSPLMSYTDAHAQLEEKIARFHGRESALVFSSCYLANIGMLPRLLNKDDVVLSDRYNHVSIYQGVALSKAEHHGYHNCNTEDLESKLQKVNQDKRLCMIATDGVFSMDGNIAPLKDICELAERYGAIVFLDDAHATGVLGRTGKGTDEYWNCYGRPDIITSSLSKAIGMGGGYVTGSKNLINLLRTSFAYAFTCSLPPVSAAVANKAFDVFAENRDQLLSKLRGNVLMFRNMMEDAGFELLGSNDIPICSIMIGSEHLAFEIAARLFDQNIFTFPSHYPAVSIGKARIRVILSASHTKEDIERTVEAFIKVGKEVELLQRKEKSDIIQ